LKLVAAIQKVNMTFQPKLSIANNNITGAVVSSVEGI
jgi:hypothetical protein